MAIDKGNFAVEIVNEIIKSITSEFDFFNYDGVNSYITKELPDDKKVELDKLVEKKLNEFELKNKI